MALTDTRTRRPDTAPSGLHRAVETVCIAGRSVRLVSNDDSSDGLSACPVPADQGAWWVPGLRSSPSPGTDRVIISIAYNRKARFLKACFKIAAPGPIDRVLAIFIDLLK